MKYTIITLLLLSFVLVSSITFDDAYANVNNSSRIALSQIEYTQDETIKASCGPPHYGQVTDITYTIQDEQLVQTIYTGSAMFFEVQANNFAEGNYKIKCSYNFGDGPIESEWKEFSIVSLIVDFAQYKKTIVLDPPLTDLVNTPPEDYTKAFLSYYPNEVDMKYDPDTKDLTISWNFGISPDRESCNSKTEFYQQNYTSIIPLTFDPNRDYLNFEGYNNTIFGDGNLYLKNTDLTNSKIDCKGSLTINIETIHPSNYTDEFSLYMTFFEVISPDKRSSTPQVGYRAEGIRVLNEAIFITTSLAEINASPCGNFTKGTDKWSFVELIHDRTDSKLTTFDTVDGCYTDSQIPLSIQQTSSKKKNGGGSIVIPHPPTGYKDSQGNEIVKNGFVYNGVVTDLTGYHTPFDKIIVTTGLTNNITVKGFDNNGLSNIKWLQIGFGMPGIGSPLANAQSLVTVYFTNTEIGEIVIREDYPLIKIISISTEIVECGYVNYDCLQVSLDHIFLDQPKYDVVAVNWLDNYSYGQTYFVNDGVNVTGESLNEPLISKVSVGKGGVFYPQIAGQVELTLVDYKTDTWQDPFGYLWTSDNYNSFVMTDNVPVPMKDPDLEFSVMKRHSSHFDDNIVHEQEKALLIFDASKLISIPAESWTYDLPRTDTEIQKELDIRIALEADRAEKELQEYFDYIYSGKVQD